MAAPASGLSFFNIRLKLLDRYLLFQLADYFLLGVVVFSLIVFFSDAFLDFMKDIGRFGIPLSYAMVLVGLQIPQSIALAMPVSTFLAVLMVINTMSSHFEIIAIRMNGISLRRLMIPALILGIFSTLTTYMLNEYAVPYCNIQSRLLKTRILQQGVLPKGRQSFSFKTFDDNHQLKQMIYVSRYDDTQMQDTTVVDLTDAGVMKIVQANSGKWFSDRWELMDANLYTIYKTSEHLAVTHSGKLKVKNPLSQQDDTSEEDEAVYDDFADSLHGRYTSFWTLLGNIRRTEQASGYVRPVSYIKLWEKITLPLSCLVLILTAVPLAITPPRQGSNRGFVFALGVLFLYYLLRSVSVATGKAGLLTLGGLVPMTLSLFLAAWLPILLMSALGVALIVRKSRVL